MQDNVSKILTEIVELPSRGLVYPEGTQLAEGKIEIKYLTAKEEDILMNESFINDRSVLDRLFKAIIQTPISYDDLLLGDRNAIMVAARILSYGPEYEIEVETPSGTKQEIIVDLREVKPKEIDPTLYVKGKNEFTFTTSRGTVLTFKLLTIADEREVDARLKGWKKINKFGQITARLRQTITSVDGNSDPGRIAQYIDNEFLAADSLAFRNYVNKIQPDLDLSIELVDEVTNNNFRTTITFGSDLFWPTAGK